jgi:hypothetical protein
MIRRRQRKVPSRALLGKRRVAGGAAAITESGHCGGSSTCHPKVWNELSDVLAEYWFIGVPEAGIPTSATA